MLKVVTLMTGKYRKVLKRGQEDKIKLLFRSLAVFDRRASVIAGSGKPSFSDSRARHEIEMDPENARSQLSGFAIDEPSNQDEEEDDDDLVLAALESLDAIEVFKHDQKIDRKIHHAHIPIDTLKNLVMMLLVFSPIGPQNTLADFCTTTDERSVTTLNDSADDIIRAFDPDLVHKGVRYRRFVHAISTCLPHLFDPLSPLFDHFLFSKNINLSKHRDEASLVSPLSTPWSSPIQNVPPVGATILNDPLLAQIATFLNLDPSGQTETQSNWQHRTQMHAIYTIAGQGTSMSSFSRQILSWSSSTLLLLSGSSTEDKEHIIIGAYLPDKWREGVNAPSDVEANKAVMFQLHPRHAVFPVNKYNKTPISYLSNKTGIALGCVIPPHSRTNTAPLPPILGPVSLSIDADISIAAFQHDGEAGSGAFMTDPGLEQAQWQSSEAQAKKINIDIEILEVWGITTRGGLGEDALVLQQKRLDWEEAEAARRRGVNFGGDKDGARALLEMAGIVGEDAQNRSGGSM